MNHQLIPGIDATKKIPGEGFKRLAAADQNG